MTSQKLSFTCLMLHTHIQNDCTCVLYFMYSGSKIYFISYNICSLYVRITVNQCHQETCSSQLQLVKLPCPVVQN